MTQIVVDLAMQDRLRQADGIVDLCDAAGHVLGRFVPAGDVIVAEPREPQIDEQEIRRRELSAEPRHSTADVLDHLRRL